MNWLKNIKQKIWSEKQTQTKHTYAEAQVITRRQIIGSSILIIIIGIFLALCFDTKPRAIGDDAAVPVIEEVAAKTQTNPDTIGQIINELPQPDNGATSGADFEFRNIFDDEPVAAASNSSATATLPQETAAPVVNTPPAAVAPAAVAPNNSQAAAQAAQEKARQQKIAQDKAAQEKVRQQKIAQQKAAEKEQQQKTAQAQEKARQQKAAQEKARQQKIAQQKAAQEKARSQAANTQKYIIQVGAFSDPLKAREMQARVQKLGLKVSLQKVTQNGQTVIKVRTAPYSSQQEAVKQAEKLVKQNIETSILPVK